MLRVLLLLVLRSLAAAQLARSPVLHNQYLDMLLRMWYAGEEVRCRADGLVQSSDVEKGAGDMSFTVSREAVDRPKHTIQAMQILQSEARMIAQLCATAAKGEVIVAVVTADLTFRGAWAVATADASMVSDGVERGGWSLVFPPQASIEDVQHQCTTVATMAAQRLGAIQRRINRHS